MIVTLIDLPATVIIRMMAQDSSEEKTCKDISTALKGSLMIPVEITEDGQQGLSFVAKHPKKNAKKDSTKATEAPKDSQGK